MPAPWSRHFRSRPVAAAAAATLGLLVALEASDSVTAGSAGDDVRDASTGARFAGAMALAISATSVSVVRHRPLPRRPVPWWVGLGLVWAGAALNRRAKRTLGANYRPRLTVVPGQRVVTDGPYRFVRHPMYSGSTSICLGIALALGTPASLAWALPVGALVHRVGVEESLLRDALGSDYAAYEAGRRRLIPGVW